MKFLMLCTLAEDCSEMIERFKLELVLKCLKSKSLQKRVRGLNDLNILINSTQRRKTYSMFTGSYSTWLETE